MEATQEVCRRKGSFEKLLTCLTILLPPKPVVEEKEEEDEEEKNIVSSRWIAMDDDKINGTYDERCSCQLTTTYYIYPYILEACLEGGRAS